MTVELVNWPADGDRRAKLRDRGTCCLLLVKGTSPPPQTVGPLEDWIRIPSDRRDLEARIASLAQRAKPIRPSLDSNGVLETGHGRVVVPDIEARLLQTMLDQLNKVTDLEKLLEAGWPGSTPSRNLFDVHLHRLRRRIGPVGLEIQTIRKRGWILQMAGPEPVPQGEEFAETVSD